MSTRIAAMTLAAFGAASLFAAEQKFGKPLEGKPSVSIADVTAKPESYVGKEIQVRGKVTEVCQAMGCWVVLTDGEHILRFQSEKHDISFPMKESVGRMARVEGKLAKYELTKEEAEREMKHAADDAGRKFDPASVKGPMVVYQLEGNGAVLE